MSIPKYPVYKQSSVSWLGPVPSHWEVLRLKHACEVFPSNVDKHSRDDEPPVLLCNYTDVYYNEQITADMPFMAATASAEQIERFTLKSGDTIITKDSETADDIAIAAYVPEDLPGVVCGYHLSMVRPRASTCGAYVKRLFDSLYVKARLAVAANGLTRVGLGQYALDNVELPFPPAEEQWAIAKFLASEASKIDALVEEQRCLIELLKEKRQAVISCAVMKGLNPSAPMKDSGVGWLGEVPAHWEISPLRRAFDAMEYGISDSLDTDGSIAVLRMGNIKDGKVLLDDLKYTDSVNERLLLQAGDLLFNRTNSLDQIGKVGLFIGTSDSQVTFASYLVRLRTNPSCSPEFFAFLLNCPGMLSEARANAIVAIGQCNLNPTRYGAFRIALPPREEQLSIAKFLASACAQLDELSAEAEEAMALLIERRSALITAAVTGKIDVRGLVPQPEAVAA